MAEVPSRLNSFKALAERSRAKSTTLGTFEPPQAPVMALGGTGTDSHASPHPGHVFPPVNTDASRPMKYPVTSAQAELASVEAFEERAAIMEFDAGLSRTAAESRARAPRG